MHAADCHHAATDFIALVARIARTRAGFAPRTSCMTLPACVLHSPACALPSPAGALPSPAWAFHPPVCGLHPPVCASTRQGTRFHMIGRRMERRLAHIFAPLSDLCRPLPDIPREPSTCNARSAGSRAVSTSSRGARPTPRAAHSAPRPVESDIRTPLARSHRGRNNAREARTRSRTSAPDPRRKRRSQRSGDAAARVALRAPRHHRPRALRTPAGTRCAPGASREFPTRIPLRCSAERPASPGAPDTSRAVPRETNVKPCASARVR